MGSGGEIRDASIWLDTQDRYGLVTRILHWSMAALILWQFGSLIAARMLGSLEILKTLAGFGLYHGTIGLFVFILIVLRVVWALANRHRRPPHAKGLAGRTALAGLAALYLTMFAVPGVALLRTFGNGRGWHPWGIPLFPATADRVDWMVELGNASHGILAWLLLALILGHIIMALVHALWLRDHVFSRMVGRLKRPSYPPTSRTS